ncbi:Uncharacterized protein ChrSV_1161 [Chromobacterium vaccinii]|nr:Uncharacterized protein ChrSW_1161 [Chromobacterium vaccinii]QND88619.1 Uncharacterized protein ChrSV_1161 [Chromobacterium vaccinii]
MHPGFFFPKEIVCIFGNFAIFINVSPPGPIKLATGNYFGSPLG